MSFLRFGLLAAALSLVAATPAPAPTGSTTPTPAASPTPEPAEPTRGAWLEVEIGGIGAASEDILETAIDEVKQEGLAGIVIVLDTPGGALENTRGMVKDMLGAPFPIVVWVGPAGSRAGSAGAFVTLAGHVAAMAPGTNIGAAHPVGGQGEDIKDEMGRKVTNDTLAFIESIAKARGRNIEMARSFVETSVSITAEEALDNKVIDLLAKDLDALMTAMDGKTVEVAEGRRLTLATATASRLRFEKSLRQKLLEIVSNPNLFYLLFMAGLIGLGYELTHPGMIFPGVVGGICMILALIATSVLPISYGAAALILVGIGCMIAEAFVASFGILGIGGFVAFVIGSVFLVDPKNEAGLRISWLTIAPGAVAVALAFVGLGYLIVRSRRQVVRSGREALPGATGVALDGFVGGRGQVRVEGAIGSAELQHPASVAKGDVLQVVAVQGLKLIVNARGL
jgi:membrane-bound serine protease (ClpP class)